MITVLKFLVVLVVGLLVMLLVAGQMGLLTGQPPSNLGFKNGRLKPPAYNPNSVSSQAALYPDHPFRAYADIAPLAYTGDGAAAFARAVALVKALPQTTVVEQTPGYLYAQCSTRWLKFTDDLELALDESAHVIHVRSSSRLGRKDFGVNRARVEAIRAALGRP
ncbi:MAG: DUF1499 domain-containing protein [Burkholderiales bacterium]|nr:DUF1499 domain-containing protein [Burkholderiales bacterium]